MIDLQDYFGAHTDGRVVTVRLRQLGYVSVGDGSFSEFTTSSVAFRGELDVADIGLCYRGPLSARLQLLDEQRCVLTVQGRVLPGRHLTEEVRGFRGLVVFLDDGDDTLTLYLCAWGEGAFVEVKSALIHCEVAIGAPHVEQQLCG